MDSSDDEMGEQEPVLATQVKGRKVTFWTMKFLVIKSRDFNEI